MPKVRPIFANAPALPSLPSAHSSWCPVPAVRLAFLAILGAAFVIGGVDAAEPATSPTNSNHWAFQPLISPQPPRVQASNIARTPIDQFILAKLEERGLDPAPPADKRALMRRATFDLTGLPPTTEEVDAFVADKSPEAFAKVVERLLASPRYGERWGRHWLDLARYADSNGMDENLAYASAGRYRDYVVASFNGDKPYNQFIREQLAGDLLPAAGTAADFERIIATGFLTIGPKMLAEDDPVKMEMDIIDEQLDTTSRAFMGLTVGCGRCHDHKFDPVPTRDYYAMAGIFKSTRTMENFKVVARWQERPLGTPAELKTLTEHRRQIDEQQQQIKSLIARGNTNLLREARARAADYIGAARERQALERPPVEAKLVAAGLKTNLTNGLIPEFVQQWAAHLKKSEKLPEADSEAWQKLIHDPKGPFQLPKNAESYFQEERIAELKQARDKLKGLEQTLPAVPEAMAVGDGAAQDLKVHKRGSHLALGEEAARGFLKSIGAPDWPSLGTNSSGRLQLAEWLVHPEHPLTARVMVNRIWHWHFGEGLVRSPDNFGALGAKPTHPELLDWLARRFLESGWSVKAMHRLIMASAVYQQSSGHGNASPLGPGSAIRNPQSASQPGRPASKSSIQHPASGINEPLAHPSATLDPENRLLSHFPRRRLEVEAIRDALLFVSGGLDLQMGGSLLRTTNRAYVTSTVNKLDGSLFDQSRRSLYLPVVRSALYDVFQVFDFADPSVLNGRRDQTTVAPQALFMMNSQLVAHAARRLAASLLTEKGLDERARLEKIYRVTYGRSPTDTECASALEYLDRHVEQSAKRGGQLEESRAKAWQSFCRTMLAANEFIYVD